MNIDITNPIFHNEAAARKHLETSRWPDGPHCPHCGSTNVMRMKGKTQKGMFLCRDCRDKFTVRTGTIMERSHVPLPKWLLAFRLIAGAKKGMSAAELGRTLGVTYKTAWFLAHRIRECMDDPDAGPLGGSNKVVEADESFFGGKSENRAYKEPSKKEAVMTLVERDGKVRSFHVADVTSKSLRDALVTTVDRRSYLMTDEAPAYKKVGKEYAGHGTVNHSIAEYVRGGGFWHTNTAECHFSLMKRAVFGSHHVISKAHLFRYVAEWDFKFNTRDMSDSERASLMVKGAVGKRLMYHQPRQTANA